MIHTKQSLASVDPYVLARRSLNTARTDGLPAARLASNENPWPPLPSVREAMIAALSEVNRYTDPAQSPLREQIAEFHSLDARQVLLGAGAGALCERVILATCNIGDAVVYARTSYPGYHHYCAVAGVREVTVDLTTDLRHDLPAMARAIDSETRVVIVCNPNNPTGTVVDLDEVTRFIAAVPETCVVLLDEAYIDFSDQPAPGAVALMSSHSNVLIARSFSKGYGLAGLRVGYLIGQSETIRSIERSMGWFQLNCVSEAAALACIEAHDEMAARIASIKVGRSWLIDRLKRLGYGVPDSSGNFVWIPLSENEVTAAISVLERDGVLARAFSAGVRVSIGTDEENTRVSLALARLA